MIRILSSAAAAAFLAFAAPGAHAQAPAAQSPAAPRPDPRPLYYPLLNKPVPDFSAPRVGGGGALRDEDLAGKWTVLEFWGVWCGDCQNDAPYTEALSSAIASDPGLSFETIHVDDRYGRWASVEAYFKEKGHAYPVALDADRSVYKAFQMQWVPTYLVVGPDKVVRAFRTDLSRDKDPEGGVKAFLKQIAALKAAHQSK